MTLGNRNSDMGETFAVDTLVDYTNMLHTCTLLFGHVVIKQTLYLLCHFTLKTLLFKQQRNEVKLGSDY